MINVIIDVLAADEAVNLLFAVLCVWAASGRGATWCALLGAGVHMALALM